MIYQNILKAAGHTPLIQLNRMTGSNDARVLVKFEGINVGGSIKTRSALRMIEAAEERGDVGEGSIIVEPTSGNQGIGLALVGAVKGYKVVIFMPDSVSKERLFLLRQYGADVRLIHDAGDIGECVKECIREADAMAESNPMVFFPNQFENEDNEKAQYEYTAAEIISDMDDSVDAFCSGVGTGGTLTGVGRRLKEVYPDIRIVACEPEKACILSGGEVGSHDQMGIGDGIIPGILDQYIYDEIILVSDEEAIDTAKKLARLEGILCGISSGSNVFTALKLAERLGKGKTVLTILPDTGERYFSTPLFK